MTRTKLVTLNAGSSSLRCAVFNRTEGRPDPQVRLSLFGLPNKMTLVRHDPQTGQSDQRELESPREPAKAQDAARSEMLVRLFDEVPPENIAAVSHRVVHGGMQYREPVEVTETTLSELQALSPLAPSHQPHNLATIPMLWEKLPNVPQIACFDTAFHASLPRNDRIFALPKDLTEDGIVRFGFHGLSFEHVATALGDIAPDLANRRVILAHLGHGVSLCALRQGRSIATTMGMTALDGVPMGQRPGALDPGIVLYLIEQKGMAPAEVRDMLYERSGLLGLSGISGEMIELLESNAPDAATAVDFFVYRCQREIGSLTAALGGLDALVFTGGMGENAPVIRQRICEGLGWLDVAIDAEANAAGELWISKPDARVAALTITTDEETVLAKAAEDILQQS